MWVPIFPRFDKKFYIQTTSNINQILSKISRRRFLYTYVRQVIFLVITVFLMGVTKKTPSLLLQETDRKGTQITEAHNNKMRENCSDISKRPKDKIFGPFKEKWIGCIFWYSQL